MAPKKAAARKRGKAPGKSIRVNKASRKRLAGRQSFRVRKNMDMDPAKLAAVKEIFGVSTETEAVDRAFDEILFEHKVTAGLDRLAASGGLRNVDPDA